MPPELPPQLELDLRKVLAGFELRVDTTLALDGITGLFGPSGGGKSTLLRLIAGFETGRGSIRLDGAAWADSTQGVHLPAHRRPVGYVFQDARLFAHLDVAGNLAFAAERRRGSGPVRDEVIAALDLEPLLGRRVDGLSGGERQRVALARTLASAPSLLLLDEPLASLDQRRKGEILPYLESLYQRFGIPAIYVSHSVDEIIRLADRVVVLEAGRIVASGATAPVFNELRATATAPASDTPSVLETRVARHLPDLALTELDCAGQAVFVPRLARRERGDVVRLRVRAADVALATSRPENLSVRNVLRGRLHDIVVLSDSAFAVAVVTVGETRLRCHLTRQAVIELGLAAGMEVFALLKTATFEEFVAGGGPPG